MNIEQFKYASDNLGYLVYSDTTAIAIDAGAVDAMVGFAQKKDLVIKYVTNTHTHPDHMPGNRQMLELTKARFIDSTKIVSDLEIELGSEKLTAIHTPGHTMDSVTFLADGFMVTGDTLFNGTVGNCFSGDLEAFYHSLKRLISLPGHTKIFAGHDYVVESMEITKKIEPANTVIDEYLKEYDPGFIVSTVADELKVNPYIRFDDPAMIENLKKRNMPAESSIDRFKSIMELY